MESQRPIPQPPDGPTLLRDLQWPFEAVRARDGRTCRWVVVHGPIVTPAHEAQFAELRRAGIRLLGMTSYLDFPRAPTVEGLDYEATCEAWCHCFRQPERHFHHPAPRLLLSASDFVDWRWIERAAATAPPREPDDLAHDVVYVGAFEPWQRGPKNWALAARCLPRFRRALGLRTLVIGHHDSEFPPQAGIRFVPALPWPQLLASMARARFLFVPNALDPSPRVIAEALCLDRPVLMNRVILGGWKYVNRYTGTFFDDENDVVEAADALLASSPAPRDWFRTHFGPEVAGARLTAFLAKLDAALDTEAVWGISAAGPLCRQAA
jgi:hypothetical protein